MQKRYLYFGVIVSIASLLIGCGTPEEKVVGVTGRITQNGTPLAVAGREVGLGRVEIALHRVAADGTVSPEFESAAADAEGHFTIRGKTGKGIPPGKYRVAIYQWDPDPTDKLAGKFSKANSPIEREIAGDETKLDIDLASPNP